MTPFLTITCNQAPTAKRLLGFGSVILHAPVRSPGSKYSLDVRWLDGVDLGFSPVLGLVGVAEVGEVLRPDWEDTVVLEVVYGGVEEF